MQAAQNLIGLSEIEGLLLVIISTQYEEDRKKRKLKVVVQLLLALLARGSLTFNLEFFSGISGVLQSTSRLHDLQGSAFQRNKGS